MLNTNVFRDESVVADRYPSGVVGYGLGYVVDPVFGTQLQTLVTHPAVDWLPGGPPAEPS